MDVIWEVHIFLKDTESICFSSCSINLFSNSLVWLAKYKEEKHEFLYKKNISCDTSWLQDVISPESDDTKAATLLFHKLKRGFGSTLYDVAKGSKSTLILQKRGRQICWGEAMRDSTCLHNP